MRKAKEYISKNLVGKIKDENNCQKYITFDFLLLVFPEDDFVATCKDFHEVLSTRPTKMFRCQEINLNSSDNVIPDYFKIFICLYVLFIVTNI